MRTLKAAVRQPGIRKLRTYELLRCPSRKIKWQPKRILLQYVTQSKGNVVPTLHKFRSKEHLLSALSYPFLGVPGPLVNLIIWQSFPNLRRAVICSNIRKRLNSLSLNFHFLDLATTTGSKIGARGVDFTSSFHLRFNKFWASSFVVAKAYV